MQLALIAVAGATGALLRYGVGRAVHPEMFPAATLTVNVTGSFAIGFVAARGRGPRGPRSQTAASGT